MRKIISLLFVIAVLASGAKVQIKRDPTDNKFLLYVNGIRIFQWLKDQWQGQTQTVKRGFGIK